MTKHGRQTTEGRRRDSLGSGFPRSQSVGLLEPSFLDLWSGRTSSQGVCVVGSLLLHGFQGAVGGLNPFKGTPPVTQLPPLVCVSCRFHAPQQQPSLQHRAFGGQSTSKLHLPSSQTPRLLLCASSLAGQKQLAGRACFQSPYIRGTGIQREVCQRSRAT